MKDEESALTVEELRKILHYDPETGIFTWLVTKPGSACIGSRAGAIHSNGYRRIRISQRLYLAHRLAWFYMTTGWPPNLDHRNVDPDDNRWSNLRVAVSRSHNSANRRRQSNNTSGFKGVYKARARWRARIDVGGKRMNLGTFDTPEEAHAAYFNAASLYFGEFARAV